MSFRCRNYSHRSGKDWDDSRHCSAWPPGTLWSQYLFHDQMVNKKGRRWLVVNWDSKSSSDTWYSGAIIPALLTSTSITGISSQDLTGKLLHIRFWRIRDPAGESGSWLLVLRRWFLVPSGGLWLGCELRGYGMMVFLWRWLGRRTLVSWERHQLSERLCPRWGWRSCWPAGWRWCPYCMET